ncbi:Renal dipeptidase family [Trinorchestia longiramus]|nr:Renal dipeptidase family [Trinorchestia longiramus]
MWAVEVPCGAQYRNAVQLLLEQLDALKRLINSQTEHTRLVTTTHEIHSARDAGVVGSLVTVGGGHGVGSSLGVLRSLPELGVTGITLTHTCPTPWAESASPSGETANTKGLTQFGKDFVVEMNRLGLLVDLGGSSTATARDAILVSRAPVLFSNAFTRAKCPIMAPSAIDDHILSRMSSGGGVVLVALAPGGNTSQNSCGHNNSVEAALEHINHIRKTAGIDHVGIGSTDNPARYERLVAELLRDASWSSADLRKLLGGNLLRVLDAVHQVRDDMAHNEPSEELIPIHDINDRWPCRYKFGTLPSR